MPILKSVHRSVKIPKDHSMVCSQLEACLDEFKPKGPWVAGSLVAFRRKCGHRGCHCQSGEGHLAHHLTYKVNGKTHAVYVPQDLVAEVQQWVREYQRLKGFMRGVSNLAMARIRTHVAGHR